MPTCRGEARGLATARAARSTSRTGGPSRSIHELGSRRIGRPEVVLFRDDFRVAGATQRALVEPGAGRSRLPGGSVPVAVDSPPLRVPSSRTERSEDSSFPATPETAGSSTRRPSTGGPTRRGVDSGFLRYGCRPRLGGGPPAERIGYFIAAHTISSDDSRHPGRQHPDRRQSRGRSRRPPRLSGSAFEARSARSASRAIDPVTLRRARDERRGTRNSGWSKSSSSSRRRTPSPSAPTTCPTAASASNTAAGGASSSKTCSIEISARPRVAGLAIASDTATPLASATAARRSTTLDPKRRAQTPGSWPASRNSGKSRPRRICLNAGQLHKTSERQLFPPALAVLPTVRPSCGESLRFPGVALDGTTAGLCPLADRRRIAGELR